MKKIEDNAKLIISESITQRVTYLHNKIGKIEWSGILLYSIKEGSIEDPKNLVLKAENIWLMDVGTSAYTEYDFGPEVMDMYDAHPEADPFHCQDNNIVPQKIGHIHTHHNMDTFFSGTDTKELEDNAPNHNYYLSLIVNFDSKWCAKIAIATEVETKKKFKWRGSKGDFLSFETDDSSQDIITIDCDIEFEGQEGIDARIKSVNDAKPKVVAQSWLQDSRGFYPSKNNGRYNNAANTDWKNPRPIQQPINDISPNQTNAFDVNQTISESKIIEYLIELVSIGTTDKPKNLMLGFKSIDEANREDYDIWQQMVEEECGLVFSQLFPSTMLSIDDIAERCAEIASRFTATFESAEWLSQMFESINDANEIDKYYGD